MSRRYVALAFSLLLAVAVAVPAIGQSSDPTATSAASAKKTAKQAKKKAKKAQQAANAAQDSADAAQSSADSAQSSADSAQSSANQALGQQDTFSYATDATATTTTLFQGGGLRIEASCPAGALTVLARSLVNDSIIHLATIEIADVAHYSEDDNFDTNQTQNLGVDGVVDSVQGTFTFHNGSNAPTVTATYLLEEDGFQANDCAAFGNVEIV